MTEEEELKKETAAIRAELLELQKMLARIYNHLDSVEHKLAKLPKEKKNE